MTEENKRWLEELYHKFQKASDFEIDLMKDVLLLYAESRIKESRLQQKNPNKKYKTKYSYRIIEVKNDQKIA